MCSEPTPTCISSAETTRRLSYIGRYVVHTVMDLNDVLALEEVCAPYLRVGGAAQGVINSVLRLCISKFFTYR